MDKVMRSQTIWGFTLSVIALILAGGSGEGTRLGLWNFMTGFRILYIGACIGFAGLALSLWGAILSRPGSGRLGFTVALTGILLGGISFGVPVNWYRIAKQVPMIHDITTDTVNPPVFVSILPLRRDAPNPSEYGGPEIAAKQRNAYPDIQPILTGLSPSKAYETALAASREMGWRIVADDIQEGRIEATATTRWFGFKDDVVIRIVPSGGTGSRLDIRSVSRVGSGDAGTNASRIRAFRKIFAGDARKFS